VSPRRIQRQRTRGWRMPEGAVYVGRPTKWGNPWRVGTGIDHAMTARECVEAYSLMIRADRVRVLEAMVELRGKDLSCWCPPDQPCHVDVLLDLANRVTPL
jgi:hypothetical protein